jgi:hypothetical protein
MYRNMFSNLWSLGIFLVVEVVFFNKVVLPPFLYIGGIVFHTK